MPRKSRQLRLSQAEELSTAYAATPFANDWRHRFILDMIRKLTAAKGTSTKQRNWLDNLIEDGAPKVESKNPKLTSEIEAAIAGFDSLSPTYDWESGVLKDMLPRVMIGRTLSEKQAALLTRLVFDGTQLAAGNIWTPDETTRLRLTIAVKLYVGYTAMWRADRPAVNRAYQAVLEYLDFEKTLKARDAHKLLDAVSTRLKRVIENPRFKTGDIGIRRTSVGPAVPATKERVMCVSDVYVLDTGGLRNDWLDSNGELFASHPDNISKR
jgi:hypothetical protein